MSKTPIAYIDIRFSVHATEDLNSVLKAAKQILPAYPIEETDFRRVNLAGHYGNPILLFETRIRSRETIEAFIELLALNLNERDKELLLEEIGLHVGANSLYIRLDKQAALLGEFKLCNNDPLRIRIRFKSGRPENIIEICRGLGILP